MFPNSRDDTEPECVSIWESAWRFRKTVDGAHICLLLRIKYLCDRSGFYISSAISACPERLFLKKLSLHHTDIAVAAAH